MDGYMNFSKAGFCCRIMAKGGNAFKKLIVKVAGSSNGRTPGFGPGYIGSSPIPAASVEWRQRKLLLSF